MADPTSDSLPPLYDAHLMLGRPATTPTPAGALPELLESLLPLGIIGGLVGSQTSVEHDPRRGNAELFESLTGQESWRPCPTLLPATSGESPAPAEQLSEALDRGAAAFRVFPTSHDFPLTAIEDALALAEARSVPLCLDLPETNWGELDQLLDRHRELDVVLSWVGYRALRRLDGLLRRHHRLHLDTVNFSTHQGWEWFIAHHGVDRLLLGTGAPVREPGEGPTRLGWSSLDAAEAAAVGRLNAARLFGLPVTTPTEPAGSPIRVAEPDRPGTAHPLAAAVRGRRPAPIPGIIDAHAHLGPYSLFFIPTPDAATMVEVMDNTGVATTILSANRAIQQDAHLGNTESLRAVEEFPDRFAAYGVVNPWQQPESELRRIAEDHRFVGIKLHPDLHHYPLTGSRYAPVWEFAQRSGCPVLVHSWHGSPFDSPALLLDIAERWPDVRVLIGHAGAQPAGMDEAAAVVERVPGVMLETCGSFMTSTLLTELLTRCGADRIIFGSDIPFIDARVSWGRLAFAGLGADQLRAIVSDNARRHFRWRGDAVPAHNALATTRPAQPGPDTVPEVNHVVP